MRNLQYGKVKIRLNDNLSYKWTIGENGCVRGYAYVGEEYLEGSTLLAYLQAAGTQEEMLKKIVQLNGLYSFILNAPFGVLACADQARSMPLFYQMGNDVMIYDNLDEEAIAGASVDEDMLKIYKICLYTPTSKTLFRDFFQVQTGYYLLINEAGIHQHPHFKYIYADQQITDMDEAIQLLDKSMTETIQRTISVLNGRTAVIPLSGGHDSRLLIFYLKKLGYQKIIAYSYGLPGNGESTRSQKIAEVLDIPWYFVDYDPEGMREFYQKEFRSYAMLAANGTSLPHLQDWYAVYKMKQQGVLPEDSVFIPGHAGDAAAGLFLWRDIAQAEPITSEKLIDFILRHGLDSGYLMGHEIMCSEEDKSAFRRELLEQYPKLSEKDHIFTAKEANQVIDQKNGFSDRTSKFIGNSVRVYDFFGYSWLMPFFERSQLENWCKIDNSLRRFKAVYFEQARRVYPDALNAIDFDPGQNWLALKDQMLMEKPSFTHYELGYFRLGEEFYNEIRREILRGPNVYVRADYLDILKEFCSFPE